MMKIKKSSFFIFSILLLLLSSASCLSGIHYTLPVDEGRVYMGIENMVNWNSKKYRGRRCILVTNHSGVDRYLKSNVSLLQEKGIGVEAIMAPEHGLYGYENEYSKDSFMRDPHTNIIVYNMHKLNQSDFRRIAGRTNIIIFDIQDMGMRCYTYISNLKFVMDSIAGTDIELIVLDRPNPIGFLKPDGAFLEPKFKSKYISEFPAPFIYGMTMGEAAKYYKGEYARNVKLTVFPMLGYKRSMLYHDTAMPWIPPSPNLPTYSSAIVYSSVVLMECINLSLGRGTPMPFEYIGAPWLDPVKLCKDLEKLNLKAFKLRPVYFTPLERKYSGQTCGGVHLIYTGQRFSPTEVSYRIIQYLLNSYPQAKWDMYQNKYEIDSMAGTDKFRRAIEQNLTFEEYKKLIEPEFKNFSKKRRKYLLYR